MGTLILSFCLSPEQACCSFDFSFNIFPSFPFFQCFNKLIYCFHFYFQNLSLLRTFLFINFFRLLVRHLVPAFVFLLLLFFLILSHRDVTTAKRTMPDTPTTFRRIDTFATMRTQLFSCFSFCFHFSFFTFHFAFFIAAADAAAVVAPLPAFSPTKRAFAGR